MVSRDIRDLTPFMQRVAFNFKSWYKRMFPRRDIILTCTYRDIYDQNRLYRRGRTKPGPWATDCDGVIKKSKHNYRPSRAFDFAVKINGKISWKEKYYDSAWLFFREAKLTKKVRWGGNWSSKRKDRPHIQQV